MARVAIVGSCITRDLWPIRGDSSEGPLYVSRTSFASLMAAPLAGFTPANPPPSTLSGYQHRALRLDLQKQALAELVAFRPTHLIVDFIDERFDLLVVGSTVITHSWELAVSGYLAQPALQGARPVARLSAGARLLWRRAAEEFAAVVRATPLREAQLILHSARWACDSRGPEGRRRRLRDVEIYAGVPADIDAHNGLLAECEGALQTLLPAIATVAAPSLRIADEAHQWGLSPFHYVPGYYEEIWGQLQKLGVMRPLSAGASAPSAPAA